MSSSSPTQSSELLSLGQAFLEKTSGAPLLSSSAAQSLRLTYDFTCPIDLLVRSIQQDTDLAVTLLAIANSPLYSFEKKISQLRQAVVLLGAQSCRQLIVAHGFQGFMNNATLEIEWARETISDHSQLTAWTCATLNKKFDLGFEGEEYTAGLVHDFGRLALAIASPEKFAEVNQNGGEEPEDVLNAEQSVIGANHCEFGKWYLESVALPDELVQVVEHHHHPIGFATLKHQPLVSVVRAADHLADFIQRREPLDEYEFENNEGLKEITQFSKTSDLVSKLEDDFGDFVNEVLESRQSIQGVAGE